MLLLHISSMLITVKFTRKLEKGSIKMDRLFQMSPINISVMISNDLRFELISSPTNFLEQIQHLTPRIAL